MSEREIKALVEMLQQAKDAYYNGDPIMSDVEFDSLEDELREIDPDNPYFKGVGVKPSSSKKWEKVAHGAPMGSLMKVQTEKDFAHWATDTATKILAAQRSGDLDSKDTSQVVSEKLDGISISLCYEKGKLKQAITRGDGVTGEDITRNVLKMKGVVKKARDFTGYVRGEIILKKSAHKKHVPEYKNPRNAASGIAKRESNAEACKHLTVMCYQVISEHHRITTKSMEFELLDALGFETPNWTVCTSSNSVVKVYSKYQEGIRDSLDYEIDGLVVEYNNLMAMEHLGEHDGRPKGARAFKFPHAEQSTRLRDIVWQVGKSGRITPVAHFDAVDLAGASVSQASLHNIDNIMRLTNGENLGMSDLILVSRRNDVIPFVEKVLNTSSHKRFRVPTKCPSCGTKLVRDGAYLNCPNTVECPAQRSGALQRWVQKLGLKDWGDALIDALVVQGLATTPADLYRLAEDDITDLQLSGKRVGARTAKKVVRNLHAKKTLRIAEFVGALGIDMWGRSMTQKIVDAGFDTLKKMKKATLKDIAEVPGVGEIKAAKFVEGMRANEDLMEDLLRVGVRIKKPNTNGKLAGQTFCFTGVRDPAFAERIADAGGSVKSSVVKGLTYLIAKDPKSTSGKAKKARQQGTKVISLEEARQLL